MTVHYGTLYPLFYYSNGVIKSNYIKTDSSLKYSVVEEKIPWSSIECVILLPFDSKLRRCFLSSSRLGTTPKPCQPERRSVQLYHPLQKRPGLMVQKFFFSSVKGDGKLVLLLNCRQD